jgi:hypothetical protein
MPAWMASAISPFGTSVTVQLQNWRAPCVVIGRTGRSAAKPCASSTTRFCSRNFSSAHSTSAWAFSMAARAFSRAARSTGAHPPDLHPDLQHVGQPGALDGGRILQRNGAPAQLWVFWIPPLIGAAIAGIAYPDLFGRHEELADRPVRDEALEPDNDSGPHRAGRR